MKLKKCRTCNGCKSNLSGLGGCEIGYKVEYRRGPFGIELQYPTELCPKPKTKTECKDAPSK